jgi:hypothetical protein
VPADGAQAAELDAVSALEGRGEARKHEAQHDEVHQVGNNDLQQYATKRASSETVELGAMFSVCVSHNRHVRLTTDMQSSAHVQIKTCWSKECKQPEQCL